MVSWAHTADTKPWTLHQKRNKATMSDQKDVLVFARRSKGIQAPPNSLSSSCRSFRTVRRVIPLPATCRKVEMRKPGSKFCSRYSFVADCVMRFTQLGPDLNLDFLAPRRVVDEVTKHDIHGLNGSGHRRHQDKIGLHGQVSSHGFGLFAANLCQRRVSVWVASLDTTQISCHVCS